MNCKDLTSVIQVVQYTNEYQTLWDYFVRTAKNGLFMFERGYMEYHKDRFCDCSLLFFQNDSSRHTQKLIALLPASLEGDVLTSHAGLTFGGFIADGNMKQEHNIECFLALKEFAKKKGIRKMIFRCVPHIYHTQMAEEDIYSLFKLEGGIEKVEAATVVNLKNPLKMPKGRKAQISRAKREGVTIEESKDFSSFIELENSVLSQYHKTKAVHTGEELALLAAKFPQNMKLFVAMLKGQMIAAALLFVYPQVVHTQYLASNDTGRAIGALDFLIASLMMQYREEKLWFDFGKSTEDEGKTLNEGLISQKEGFGGRTCVYQTWQWEIGTLENTKCQNGTKIAERERERERERVASLVISFLWQHQKMCTKKYAIAYFAQNKKKIIIRKSLYHLKKNACVG